MHFSVNGKTTKRGFTLVELLVVIAIIGVLSSIVVSSIGSARQKARDVRRISDMKQLDIALNFFFDDNRRYPSNADDGVSNLGEIIGDDNGPIEQALAQYLTAIPKDPLYDGVTYFYSYDPIHCSDLVRGSCACDGPRGATLAFNKAEGTPPGLRKDICSGADMSQNTADYNIVLFPSPN